MSLDGGQKFLLDVSNYLDVLLPPQGSGEHAVRMQMIDMRSRAMKAQLRLE